MARPLSNIEYATFMTEVQPDSLGLPDWGGIVSWGGEFVLMFKMPSGEWALSDVTDGIPTSSGVIMPMDYLRNVPGVQTSAIGVFLYSIPANFMATALEKAAEAGNLASSYVQWTAQQVGDAISAILKPISSALPLTPIIVGTIAVLAFLYLPHPRKSS